LAYEPFGEPLGPLSNSSGGGDFGWGSAWIFQNGNDGVPGYDIVSTGPMNYTGLVTTPNHLIGGEYWQYVGRQLDVTPTGSFAPYLFNGLIGVPGQTLWLSALMREDASNMESNLLGLNPSGGSNSWLLSSPSIWIGYCGSDFGGASSTNGTPYWSLVDSGEYWCNTAVQSNVPVIVGQPSFCNFRNNSKYRQSVRESHRPRRGASKRSERNLFDVKQCRFPEPDLLRRRRYTTEFVG
jgi:hypothetical protein